MTYESFQIVTNGEKFRIRVSVKYLEGTCFDHMPSEGYWYGSASGGYCAAGPKMEFNSRQEAVDFIRKEYGEVGYRKLLESWNPC